MKLGNSDDFSEVNCALIQGIDNICTSAHLAEIAELVDVAICAWNADLRIIYINDRYRRLVDTAPENLYIGMKLEELTHILTESGTLGIITDEKTRKTNIDEIRNLATPTVTQHVSRSGRLYERHRYPFRDGGGCALMRDVTSSKHTVPFANSTALISDFMHYHPDGCALYDPDDRLVTCNALFAKLYNSMPQDLVGLHFTEIIALGDANSSGFPSSDGTISGGLTTSRKRRLSRGEQNRFGLRSRDGRFFLIQDNVLPSGHILTFRTDVTDIKATEDALRRSTETVGAVNRLARIGSWSIRFPSEKLEWSDEQFRIYGYEPGEVPPTRELFQSHIHPDEKDTPGRTINSSAANHDDEQWLEFRIIRKDGAVRWLSSYRQYFYSEDGNILRVNGVSQDITDRKHIEEEVERGRELLQNAIDSMESGFRLMGPDGIMVTCNQRYREIYPEIAHLLQPGVPIETMRRKYYKETGVLYHGGVASDDTQFTSLKPLKRLETRTPSGAWLTVSESLTQDGSLVSVATDISAYKEIEQRLASSEARFRSFTDISTDWFWEATFDTKGKLRYRIMSSRFYEFSGLKPEQVEGEVMRNLPIKERVSENGTEVDAATRAGKPFRNAVVGFRRDDGKRVFARISAKPVTNPDGKVTGYLGTGQDITKERLQAIELREAKELAESANRAKSDFLASMSHELRTPLNAIIGFSELIQSELYGPIGAPQYREYVGDIMSSGNHLLALINDILDLSKVEAGSWEPVFEPVSLVDISDRCRRLFERQIRDRNLNLKIQISHTLPEVHTDNRAIFQILVNLLSNAVKFTEAGGVISVMTVLADDHVEISVSDTGIGIPDHELIRVQEPFEQVESVLERSHQGTGLGLSIVKSLTEILQGEFSLTSRTGIGTTATVRLPLHPIPAD